MILEGVLETEAVSSLGIDMQGGGDAFLLHRKVVVHTVGRRYGAVVIGKEDDGARRLRVNLFLVAVEVNEVLTGIAPY